MRHLLLIICTVSFFNLTAQDFKSDWDKVARKTFSAVDLSLMINYTLYDRLTNKIIEKQVVEVDRDAKNYYMNHFGVETLVVDEYIVLADNRNQVMSVFKNEESEKYKESLKNEQYIEMLEDFVKESKAFKETPSNGNIVRYVINKPNPDVEKVDIDFDKTTFLLKNVTYCYKTLYNASSKNKESLLMPVDFNVLPSKPFSHPLNGFVSITNRKVSPKGKYIKYKVISHL